MNKKQESTNRKQDKASVKNIQTWLRGLSLLVDPHPSVKDIGERRRAQLLNIITLILTAMFILGLVFASSAGTFIFLLLIASVSFVMGKTKYYKAGSGIFTFGFISSAYFPLLSGTAGSFESSIYSTVPVALIVASVLVGQMEFLFLAIFATLATFLAPYYSTIPTPEVLRTGGIVMTIGVILYGINVFRASVERARLREVQDLNNELNENQTNLEQRVADRTKALATSAEVTRRLATVLEPRQLISEVVNEVRNAFDYYYAQIYLLDEAGENLVVAGGTGQAGASMLARKHSIRKGRGLVGRTADANASVLVPDVSQEEGWLPNELLPETKAETSIPISVGNQVLGVLDVQHNIVGGLTVDDVTLLESLAGQVAITLQNARSYEQSRKQAELESLVNLIGQKIQRTTTMEDTLQTAIRELGTAIGASRVKASLRPAASVSTGSVAPSEPLVAVVAGDESISDPEATPAD